MLLTTGTRINSDDLPYGQVEGDWSDRTVYVIGAGPSLEGFNFSKLDGYTIGANKSAIVANADAMFSMDWKYNVEMHEDIVKYPGKKYFAVMTKHNLWFDENTTYLKSCREGRLSDSPTHIIGLNSGYGSLNIAFLKGAKHIRLLGFDMMLGPKKHFHGGYHWDKSKGASFNSWARRFRHAAEILKERNIKTELYVGNKGSGISQYFTTKSLKELDPEYPQ